MSTSVQPPLPARHVVFVLDHFYPHVGGAETLFGELARGLIERGQRVSVVTRRDQPEHRAREFHDGVEIHRVRSPQWLGRLGYLLAVLPAVCRVARTADLVHAGGYGSMLPAWLAARWRGRPAVVTVFEVMAEQMRMLTNVSAPVAWGLRLFERILLALPFARYACISEYTRSRLLRVARVPARKVVVVYPAVDYAFWDPSKHRARPLREELGIPESTRLGLFFGRPGASKGIDTLIGAAERLKAATDRPCHLVLILAHEPASGRKWVLDAIRQRGLESLVTVLEPVPRGELPGYLLAADCVIIPSLSEGFGYSAVEAATLGCRVIATSGHAVEEVVGRFVRLVAPRDAAALARAIQEDADASARGIYPSAEFTVEAHVAGIIATHDSVLGRSESGPALPEPLNEYASTTRQ